MNHTMSSQVMPHERKLLWSICGLTAAYALILALALHPATDLQTRNLIFVGVFAGPMLIACLLSILMTRVRARTLLLGFEVGYSILTAIILGWTFGIEHDAQYQLMLLLIPVLGFPAVVITGVTAVMNR